MQFEPYHTSAEKEVEVKQQQTLKQKFNAIFKRYHANGWFQFGMILSVLCLFGLVGVIEASILFAVFHLQGDFGDWALMCGTIVTPTFLFIASAFKFLVQSLFEDVARNLEK